jgi:lysophospholipase L1-like esterase
MHLSVKHIKTVAAPRHLIALGAFLLMSFLWPTDRPVKVYLIGDSTMCLYSKAQSPLTGWGMPFADYLDKTITVDNRAHGGRSTRTFLSENRWKPVADSLHEGDYVLMQFGHNDEAKEPKFADRYTPVADYKTNLIKFITETRSKKATPVLITPVTRRSFNADGTIKETHQEYSDAVREIGKTLNVPVIDLDERSREMMQALGPDASEMLYISLPAGENPNYPDGRKDNTHFNEYGARRVAELVLNEIKRLKLDLADHIVKPATK